MNYELLPKADWPQLKPVFEKYGSQLQETGSIAVARNGTVIAAFHCLQPVYHIEPIWVRPDYSGKVEFRKLLEVLKRDIPAGNEFYAFAPDKLIERICEHLELKQAPYTVWKGKV